MKTKMVFKIFLPILMLCTFSLRAQNLEQDIASAFRKMEVSRLSPYLSDKVNFVSKDQNREISASEATSNIERFITNNQTTGYSEIHKSLKGDSGFIISKLTTRQGCYRVHLLLKKKENKFYIYQIRIENFDE